MVNITMDPDQGPIRPRNTALGDDANLLVGVLSVWHYIGAALSNAQTGDLFTFSSRARQDMESFADCLTAVLSLHGSRNQSKYCPCCSTATNQVLWPCKTWRVAAYHLGYPLPAIPDPVEEPPAQPTFMQRRVPWLHRLVSKPLE